MFKYICILLLLWLLIRTRNNVSHDKKQSHRTTKRETPRPSQPEGTTTVTRIEEPKNKVIDASTAENAHFEETSEQE